MHNTSFSWTLYHQAPMIGILRGFSRDNIHHIAQKYEEAGLYTLEITMNTPGATDIISKLREAFPKLNIGAGTVCNVNDLKSALNAGAQFIVCPILDEEVIKISLAEKVPVFPGAYTPTEIYKAWSLGASAVKVFPASQLGVKYIKDILAPLNEIKLVPTGGVSLDNMQAFFEAGVFGVGMGSAIFDKTLIQNEDYEGLKGHFVKFKNNLREIKKN